MGSSFFSQKIQACLYKDMLHSTSIIKSLKSSHEGLQKLNQVLDLLPYPKYLLYPIQIEEATFSLESQTSQTSILSYLLYEKNPSKNLQPILNYKRALIYRHAHQSKLTLTYLKHMHVILEKDSNLPFQDIGKIRNKQNWIGPIGGSENDAHYFPPPPEEVLPLMQHFLISFNQKTNHPLLQLAILFGEFLIIHPFMDGNGRLARILSSLFLFWHKQTSLPSCYFSRFFLKNRKKYLELLFYLTYKSRWEPWILFFLKAIEESALFYAKRIHAIHSIYDRIVSIADHKQIKQKKIRYLISHPLFDENLLCEKLDISSHKASQLIKALKKAKLIKQIRKNGQKKYFLFSLFE